MSQAAGANTINWSYNSGGGMVGFSYNGTDYYYVRNMQNDIVAIYNASGAVVAKYLYDAFGNVTVTQNVGGIADVNPIRYRGYYWDSEIQMYYCQSRYYNPQWRRFINADITLDTGGHVLGTNVFAYCVNDPINGSDPCGHCYHKTNNGRNDEYYNFFCAVCKDLLAQNRWAPGVPAPVPLSQKKYTVVAAPPVPVNNKASTSKAGSTTPAKTITKTVASNTTTAVLEDSITRILPGAAKSVTAFSTAQTITSAGKAIVAAGRFVDTFTPSAISVILAAPGLYADLWGDLMDYGISADFGMAALISTGGTGASLLVGGAIVAWVPGPGWFVGGLCILGSIGVSIFEDKVKKWVIGY